MLTGVKRLRSFTEQNKIKPLYPAHSNPGTSCFPACLCSGVFFVTIKSVLTVFFQIPYGLISHWFLKTICWTRCGLGCCLTAKIHKKRLQNFILEIYFFWKANIIPAFCNIAAKENYNNYPHGIFVSKSMRSFMPKTNVLPSRYSCIW